MPDIKKYIKILKDLFSTLKVKHNVVPYLEKKEETPNIEEQIENPCLEEMDNMSYPRNYIKFPDNVMKPETIELSNGTYTSYGFKFKGLHDFYEFLKQHPNINYEVWHRGDLSSVDNSYNFAGVPYDEAVEKLIEEMDPGYQEYLKIQKNIRAKMAKVHQYEQIKTIAGGVIDPVSYTTGSPTIYRTSRLISRPKFITVDTQIAYYHGTSKSQVFNKALIITNLIRALERNGYTVDVNAFMAAERGNELIQAIFEIKQQGQRTNYQALYKSLVDVEFFRRLCFRLMEISDVQSNWCFDYGSTCNERVVRELLKLKKDDIYFGQPSEMGIRGRDIGEDFESAIRHLKLEKSIDIPREKEILRQSVKVLKR